MPFSLLAHSGGSGLCLRFIESAFAEVVRHSGTFPFHPKGKSFLNGVFRTMNPAAFDGVPHEGLLLRSEINVHALKPRDFPLFCQHSSAWRSSNVG